MQQISEFLINKNITHINNCKHFNINTYFSFLEDSKEYTAFKQKYTTTFDYSKEVIGILVDYFLKDDNNDEEVYVYTFVPISEINGLTPKMNTQQATNIVDNECVNHIYKHIQDTNGEFYDEPEWNFVVKK